MPAPLLCAGRSVLLVAGGGPAASAALGLGDLLRVVMMVPVLGARAVAWCSDPALFALVRDCAFLSEMIPGGELTAALSRFERIINLTFADLPGAPPEQTVEIRALLAGNGTMKERTFDLPGLLAGRLGIGTVEPLPVARAGAARCDIGFNLRLPPAWGIKALPPEHWQDVARRLPPGVTVTWQPEDGGLDAYVAWVKGCRVLVSVVGLGCHIAMLYGRSLVMLSGPTDFAEIHHYARARVLYPPVPCPYRPCQQSAGVEDCGGCMPHFRPQDIAAAALALLERADL
ncbi:hypothetical protein [Azospirillum sp.]|uniref:glycosyltransferase family 9 protein n=1 Tax=Azospirillum sp. TaxID=34012 RepID=UPI002D32F813|nr:hypothetical protein [Azospirillum sp.]HYD70493.1 hypothetical protein [Azospirillum sp.]